MIKTYPSGTLIHIEGIPFALANDTDLEGVEANFKIAEALEAARKATLISEDSGPVQAEG